MKRTLAGALGLGTAILAGSLAAPAAASCPGDCGDGNGVVGMADLLALLRQFGGPGSCDLAANGTVGGADLAFLISRWGPCPVSAGACCLGDGLCDASTQDECSAVGGKTWIAGASCDDIDGDRIADAFELADCSPFDGCTVGTDPYSADTDGDGILDWEEVYGTSAGLDLPAMGADPLRKDVFVEIDWMDDALNGAHSHRPTSDAIKAISLAFQSSPVSGPCGSTGIAFHADHGQGGPFTGGGLIGDDTVVMFNGEFGEYKAMHFDPARMGIFRYSIHCHRYNSPTNSSTGVAEINGDDSIVSLQNFLTFQSISVILMHELGHNLGLRHGGLDAVNYKPNYNSVMNYRFALPGLDIDCDGAGDGFLGYSPGSNPPLYETHLIEADGICGVPVDWNGDQSISSLPLSFNVNCATGGAPCGAQPGGCADSTCGLLLDHDDWSALSLSIPSQDDFTGEIVTCLSVPTAGD